MNHAATGSAPISTHDEQPPAPTHERNAMLLPDDRHPRHLLRSPSKFCPYSLGDWIGVCQRAEVPHVPAMHVADFEPHDILQHEHAGPHQRRLDAAYEAVRRASRPGWMLRWDCCASADLKFSMAEGRTPDDNTRQKLPIDCRLQEILHDYPRTVVPVWRRPWMGEQMFFIDGYPVEYRAFVENGELIGISSYYPQRPLPRDDRHLAAIEKHIAALLGELEGPFEWPAHHHEAMGIRTILPPMPRTEPRTDTPHPDGVHFTVDFAATRLGMLLIEGGPPHFMGAHPCCFPPGRIAGIALEAQRDARSAANAASTSHREGYPP
jgi:hypothetical protein